MARYADYDDDIQEQEICEECQGTGVMDCPLEYGGPHPENCPACGGEETVPCIYCNGSGLKYGRPD